MAKGNAATLVISLAYEGWEYNKGEKTTADLKIDDRTLFRKAVWQAPEKTILTGTFTEAELRGACSAFRSRRPGMCR